MKCVMYVRVCVRVHICTYRDVYGYDVKEVSVFVYVRGLIFVCVRFTRMHAYAGLYV